MKRIVVCILLSQALYAAAQEYPRREIDLEQLADELYGFQDADLNYEEIYENLALLLAHPVNLNKASAEELRFLKILSETQIQNLITYRNENGDLISIYELQAIAEFDAETIYKLVSLAEVRDALFDQPFLERIKNNKDNYLLMRYERTLEKKKGFLPEATADQRFHGSPDKVYLRYRNSKPGDFSFGFTAEKDQGEAFVWNPSRHQSGFDFLSFHAQVQNKRRIKNLLVGDYQCQFGQGLMYGGIFGIGKGGETITTTRRSTVGILPYTSVNETGYFRGTAATVTLADHVQLTGLYSRTFQDGTVNSGTEDEPFISAFQTTGLHRNNTELSKRKQIGEHNAGAILQYQTSTLDAGVMYHHLRYDFPVYRKPNLYNQFVFSGQENNNVGLYLNYNYHNLAFFSEIASSLNHGNAFVAGALTSLTSNLDFSLLYRHYAKNFYSFYANGFAENSTPQNETGIYWGWKYRINKKLNTTGYFDLFKFPWLKYRTYAPSTGREGLLRLNYQPSRSVRIFVQAREEVKARNASGDDHNVYVVAEGKKRNYWINFDYSSARFLRFKTRLQYSTFTFNNTVTKGFVILQDAGATFNKFRFTARYALFHTDDYDNRQYVYENDVWLAYSLPAFYGVGIRKYILAEYHLNKHFSFWIRFSTTRYTDRDTIGSGADAIYGNTRNDVKFETRIRF